MQPCPLGPGAEISGLLKHLQHTPRAEQAWQAMQRYRAVALGPLPPDVPRREAAAQSRERLRSRLLQLLVNGDTAGPAVEYVVDRTEVLCSRDQQRKIRWRADDVDREMFLHELNVLDMDNFPAGHVALLAATNNLAPWRLALDDERITDLARIHGEARRRIERLLEALGDASA